MEIAPLPVNHTGMHGEDMATAVAWYRPSLCCYLIDGRVRFTDADPTSGRSQTGIDRVDIHFIHVRSMHEDGLPLIMTHGWPGSFIELLETVSPLTDPTAHGPLALGRGLSFGLIHSRSRQFTIDRRLPVRAGRDAGGRR